MKRYIPILMVLLAFANAIAQSNETIFTDKNFDTEFFNYKPIQRDGVSNKGFEHYLMILSETKKALKNNPNNYHVAHYWNIATIFSGLKEEKEYIKIAFLKAARSKGVCQYFESFKNVENHFSKDIPNAYSEEEKKCSEKGQIKIPVDLTKYANEHDVDLKLISLISKIDLLDQEYRLSKDQKSIFKQNELDKRNQILIDSLYKEYDSYIGISLVGEKFSHVMWAVVQHSNPEMMEKYLPIVHQAVTNNELHETPLKMLIDRFYALKYGYQIFGSQSGIKIAHEETRKKIMAKYWVE